MSNLLTLSVRFPTFQKEVADKLTDEINTVELTQLESKLASQLSTFLTSAVIIKDEQSTTYITSDLMLTIKRDHIDLFSSSARALQLSTAVVSQTFEITQRESKLIDVADSILVRETATDSVISESELIDSLKALAKTAQQSWTIKEALTLDNSHSAHAVHHVCLRAA